MPQVDEDADNIQGRHDELFATTEEARKSKATFSSETVLLPKTEKARKRSWLGRCLKAVTRPISRASTACWTNTHRAQHNVSRWFADLPIIVWFENRFPGWQAGVVLAIAVAVFVLIFNSVFLILAMRHHWGLDGLGILIEGDCARISKWNKIAHGFINIMSTFLLMQSNYCMQLLASPTRHNVDIAHRKRQWVDVGIQSFRNVWMRHISPWRCFYWTVLAVSSVPLHLLWNSVIIFSPSAFQYNQLTVSEGFVRRLPFKLPSDASGGILTITGANQTGTVWPDSLYILQQQELQQYETLSNVDCKRAYAQSFVRERSDVIVVTKPVTSDTNSSTVLGASSGGWGLWPFAWLCPPDLADNFKCYDQIRQNDDAWDLPNYDSLAVEYCLSKPMQPRCKLEYGFWIALFTIIANIMKVICFIITFRILRSNNKTEQGVGARAKQGEKLLITTGDAIASFLEFPDNETFGMSIVEKEDFRNGIWALRWVPIGAMIWRDRSECSWFRAVGLRRWIVAVLLLGALAVTPSVFLLSKLSWFINSIGLTGSALNQLGIGNPSGLFLFGTRATDDQFLGWGLLGKVALANTPQLIVSVAYYLWNNHLTAMVAAREYDMYAAPVRNSNGDIGSARKRGLRVTNPRKQSDQISTRFLTIPLSYWIANIVLWTLLHYLASQAVFFARVDVLDHWQEVTQWSISQVGYSVLGLIYFLICAHVAFFYAMFVSLRRLHNRMPLAATCSGALSAACHPKNPGIRHYEKKVQWGVEVSEDDVDRGTNDEKLLMRCTFTSGEAYYPETDKFYS